MRYLRALWAAGVCAGQGFRLALRWPDLNVIVVATNLTPGLLGAMAAAGIEAQRDLERELQMGVGDELIEREMGDGHVRT
jgi:hypothetical protein